MSRLTAVDPVAASGEARELLDVVRAKFGFAPNVVRVMANAPAALKAYLGFGEALSGGQFDAKTREAFALVVAAANNCEYCASAHSAISKSLKVDDAEIDKQLDGQSADPKLEAALIFARKVVEARGSVSDADIAGVRAAGHDDGAITEIVANVAVNVFTNYLNNVARTEIDFPKIKHLRPRAA